MIQLQWTSVIVQLASPEFSDSRGVRLNTLFKRSRNGTRYAYAAPDAEIRVLNMTFAGLSREQVRNYFALMYQSKGKGITLTLYNGEIWSGSIISPVTSTHHGINNSDLTIQFEGKRL